jgi:hypothetical protein
MNFKLTVAFIIACTSYQYSHTMDKQLYTSQNMNKEVFDALLAKTSLPKEVFKPSGLSLEDDIERCNALNKKVQKFNGTLNADTDFKALEQATTQALVATIQYLNNPALDPNTAQDQNAKTAIMIKRLDPTPASNMIRLASLRLKAAYLQTPEGLKIIAQYKEKEEEKRLLLRRALSAGMGAGLLLFYGLHNSAL